MTPSIGSPSAIIDPIVLPSDSSSIICEGPTSPLTDAMNHAVSVSPAGDDAAGDGGDAVLLTPSSILTGCSSPLQLRNDMMTAAIVVSPSNSHSSTKRIIINDADDTAADALHQLPSMAATVSKKKRSLHMFKLARKACSSGLKRSAYFLRRVQKAAAVQSHSSHAVKITYHNTSPDKIMTYMSNPLRRVASSSSSLPSNRRKGIMSPSSHHQHLQPSHTPDAGEKVVSTPCSTSSFPLKIIMSNPPLSLSSPTPVKSPIYCFSPSLSLSQVVQSNQSSLIDHHHTYGSCSSTDDNSSNCSYSTMDGVDSPVPSSTGSIDACHRIPLQEEEEEHDFSSPTCTLQVTREDYRPYSLGSYNQQSSKTMLSAVSSPDNCSIESSTSMMRMMLQLPEEDLYSKLLRELRLHFIAEQQSMQ